MERYTMAYQPQRTSPLALFEDGTCPQLAHLQRVFAQDYGCLRAPHAHENTVELVLITNGTGVFSINGVRIPMCRGQLAIYNSGIVHEEQFTEKNDFSCFSCSIYGLHRKGLRPNALIPDDMFPRFDAGSHFHEIEQLIETMLSQYAAPMPHSEGTAQLLLWALLSMVIDLTGQPQSDIPVETQDSLICESVKRYIDRHFSEELTLQMIADAVHISVSHMSHVFKAKVGYSPLQYIVHRRIGEAQTLLETTDLSATSIGMAVGFPNPSYFNVIFNKKCNMTPLQYRKIYALEKSGE